MLYHRNIKEERLTRLDENATKEESLARLDENCNSTRKVSSEFISKEKGRFVSFHNVFSQSVFLKKVSF